MQMRENEIVVPWERVIGKRLPFVTNEVYQWLSKYAGSSKNVPPDWNWEYPTSPQHGMKFFFLKKSVAAHFKLVWGGP